MYVDATRVIARLNQLEENQLEGNQLEDQLERIDLIERIDQLEENQLVDQTERIDQLVGVKFDSKK